MMSLISEKRIKEISDAVLRLYEDDYEECHEWMGDSPSTIVTTTIDEQREGDYETILDFLKSLNIKEMVL